MPEVGIPVIVEIPRGCRNKYEYDHATGRIRLDRTLFSPVHYPADYGFVPDTLGEDEDPLDALVLVSEPTFPGCLIQVRVVGVLRMRDEKGPDDKLLTVPLSDPTWNVIRSLGQVQPHLLREIEHFFSIYKELEDKTVAIDGWDTAGVGRRLLAAAQRRFPAEPRGPGPGR